MTKEPEPSALMRILQDKMAECAELRSEVRELKAMLESDYTAISRIQTEYLGRYIDDVDNGRPSKFSYAMLRHNYLFEKKYKEC